MAASQEDAKILIDLVRWTNEMGLSEALREVYAPSFDANDGSVDSPAVWKVLMFGETVGTMVKHRVLDWDLVSDLFWFEGMWRQVAAHARYIREQNNEPKLYEHFESLATLAGS